MDFQKLNKVQKLWLKLNDKEGYKNYKFLKALQHVPHVPEYSITGDEIHFKHSGNAGDIIYAMPAMYALAQNRNIHLHLKVNERGHYGKMHHPLQNLMLNEKMVELLRPLLLSQPLFKTCDVYRNQRVDVDLNVFRDYPFNLRTGNIARWYFLVFAINADLGKPWLIAEPDKSVKEAIVLARSFRYRAPGINYSFLKAYTPIVFVGLQDEYDNMKKLIPHLQYRPVKNFLEMAELIRGSKLFIGNQSFPFAIAEGLKVRRLLEVYHQSPNVIVEGKEGYDFCYQLQFERLVSRLYGEENKADQNDVQ